MTYECRFLSTTGFPEIHATFVRAFSDYAVDMSYMTEQVTRNRMVKNAVDLESSVGVFWRDEMVGFTLIGIGSWDGTLAAFDAGTGIVEEHRGRGLARRMFDMAEPRLQAKGVKTFLLEVLQQNTRAIRAYAKSGFRVTREFDCLELSLSQFWAKREPPQSIEVRRGDQNDIDEFADAMDWRPSWENSVSAVKRIPDDLLVLRADSSNAGVGILIYYGTLNWLLTLVVRPEYRRQGIGSLLLSTLVDELRGHVESIKMINVLRTDDAMLGFTNQAGFDCYVRQYEMERAL